MRQLIDEMCQFILQLEPKAKILDVEPEGRDEGEDAVIRVLLPYREWNRKADKITDAIYQRVWEIEMERGYFIGVSLRTLDQMKATVT
ncbi:MAG: hypothetical protein NZ805_11990 [Armatimonadetes bacterium]|nr:hypothetical protein [Armatimonadota bacterium]MDW8028392.1 hypothetical protein [Armatimonadota bacterium]